MTPIELLLSKLPEAKRRGAGWHARCPAHDDRRPSLSIAEGDDGRALVHCHAGCTPPAIVEAVGLNLADLMPVTGGNGRRSTSAATNDHKPGNTFATTDEAIAALERSRGPRSALWRYDDAEGQPFGYVVRWDDPGGGKDVRPVSRVPGVDGRWTIGAMAGGPGGRPLYRLPDLLNAPEGSRVYVCEGEKAADAARSVGLIATTSAHGSKSASKTDWSPLAAPRISEVVILPDADIAGERYAGDVAELVMKLKQPPVVKVVRLPSLPFGEGGDVAEFVAMRGGGADTILAEIEALADRAEAAPSTLSPTTRDAPRLIRMADVEPVDVGWLWPLRIPVGRMTLLVGRPGDGKSFLTAYLAATVSRGRHWIDGSACPRGSVVLCSAEDDPADTIAPRLIAHDADLDRIHLLAGVTNRDDRGEDVERVFTLADLATLRQTLERLSDCELIVVDPIGSYLGGRADAHRDNEVRGVLAPVCHLAAQHGAALVVIAHTRKAPAAFADDTAMGSRAFTGLARSVLHLVMDPDDENRRRRLLLAGKTNLTERPPGLAFDIGPGPRDDQPCVRWHSGEVDLTADEAVNRASQRDNANATKRDKAADWLRQTLAEGPRPAQEIIESAKKEEGITPRTLERAKKLAGVDSYKPLNPGPWWWRLRGSPADRHTPNERQVGDLAVCCHHSTYDGYTPNLEGSPPDRQPVGGGRPGPAIPADLTNAQDTTGSVATAPGVGGTTGRIGTRGRWRSAPWTAG